MKIFALILSFYLLWLTVLPCIDVPQDEGRQKAEVSQKSHDPHHHSDADNCSPFCSCNCCATSVVFQEYLVRLQCFPFAEKRYFPVAFVFVSDPLASIWQPPKIA